MKENNYFDDLIISRLNPWDKDAVYLLILLPQVAATIVAAYVYYQEINDSRDGAHELLWGTFLWAGKPLSSGNLLKFEIFLWLRFNLSFDWNMRL